MRVFKKEIAKQDYTRYIRTLPVKCLSNYVPEAISNV